VSDLHRSKYIMDIVDKNGLLTPIIMYPYLHSLVNSTYGFLHLKKRRDRVFSELLVRIHYKFARRY
jgi:hypothetical protein